MNISFHIASPLPNPRSRDVFYMSDLQKMHVSASSLATFWDMPASTPINLHWKSSPAGFQAPVRLLH